MKRFVIVLGIVALAGPVMAANSLTVTGAAALEGNYGLSVNIDGSNNLTDAYVVSSHPNAETTYNVEFLIDPGTLNIDTSDGTLRHFIMGDGWTPSVAPAHFLFMWLYKTPAGFWRLQVNAREDGGPFQEWQGGVPICDAANPNGTLGCNNISTAPIRVEWAAATAPGANDGYIKAYRSWDGGSTYSIVINITGLDNDTYVVDNFWAGAIFMANGTHNRPGVPASGSYYFDSFVSTR